MTNLLANILSVLLTAALYPYYFLFGRPHEREAYWRANCERYLQTEYGAMIEEAKRQQWISNLESSLTK